MLEMLIVLFVITWMGIYAANQEDVLSKGLSWFLALMALNVLCIFYSVFLKHWSCCCFAYQPEFPQRNLLITAATSRESRIEAKN